MSRKVEQAVGGLVQSLLGSFGSQGGLFGGGAGRVPSGPSLGFLSFVERAQEAWQRSREAELEFFTAAASCWQEELSKPSTSNTATCEVLQRALVAGSRGYTFPRLHIHAVKLAQTANVGHKKIGYQYLSVCVSDSELSVLMTNTLHKDVQSSDALAVLAALTAVPAILDSEVPPQLTTAIIKCLHHPLGLVRRRACQVMCAGVATVWAAGGSFLQQLLEEDVVSVLLQLLSDPEPSVVLAATRVLAQLYKHQPERLDYARNSVACSAAHLLTQAFNAALPRHYSMPPLHAPHAQLHMIQALRILTRCGDQNWRVPVAVTAALTPVLTQVWGSGHAGLCMTLLEAVLLTMELPETCTAAGLRNTAMNTLLGFLKSSDGKLQFVAVQSMAAHWSLLCDAVTTAHLQAVVHNLHTTTCTLLQHTSLSLLYTMANEHNYKCVVTTLVQYCAGGDAAMQCAIHEQLASIVAQCGTDVVWCVTALQDTVMTQQPAQLMAALARLVVTGLSSGGTALLQPALTLLSKVLSQASVSTKHVTFVATILAQLNDSKYNADHAGLGTRCTASHVCHTRTKSRELVTWQVTEQSDALFIDDGARTMLNKINELFITRIYPNEITKDHQCVFECFKKIGLFNSELRQKVIDLVTKLKASPDLICRHEAQEVLLWLQHDALAIAVLEAQRSILNSDGVTDWSLPALEEYVIESVEKHGEKHYIPPNLFSSCEEKCLDLNKTSNSSSDNILPTEYLRSPISYSTPRSELHRDTQQSASSLTAPRTEHPHSVAQHSPRYSDNISDKSSQCYNSQSNSRSPEDESVADTTDESVQSITSSYVSSVPLSISSVPFSVSSVPFSVSSVPLSIDFVPHGSAPHQEVVSGNLSHSPVLGDVTAVAGLEATKCDRGGSPGVGSAHKLLWSLEGRCLDWTLPSSDDSVEVGAEAREELLLEEDDYDDTPSTAAALAKTLYASLAIK